MLKMMMKKKSKLIRTETVINELKLFSFNNFI